MDEKYLEQAERLAESEVRAGIERAQKRTCPPPGFDGTCECGSEIPKPRVELGYYRCTDCQSFNEKRAKQFR